MSRIALISWKRVPLSLQTHFRKSLRTVVKFNSTQASATGFNDYEVGVKNFQLDVPEYYNFATDVIDVWAEREKHGEVSRGGNPAFWLVDEVKKQEYKWGFQELSEKSKRTANMLKYPCGIRKGDRLLVILPRIPQWWLVNIACMRLGAILIPGTTMLTSKDILHRLQRSQAKIVIADELTANKVEQVAGSCPELRTKIIVTDSIRDKLGWYNFNDLYHVLSSDNTAVQSKSDEPMTVFFTSGTTGLPKMTEHTFASYGLACKITGKYWLDLTQQDVHWNLSDTGWAKSAWSSLFAPWYQGSCIFVHNSDKFDAHTNLKVLEDYPVTTFCAAPTAYRMFVQEDLTKYNFKSLRHCVSAGEPLNPEVIDTWKEGTGQILREGYGQTETVLQVGSFRCIPHKPGSMGKPAPGMDVRVIDGDCNEVEPGIEGDLAIKIKPDRPVGLFSRYADDMVRTENAFSGDYYITGDRAVRDEDGYLWFIGRADDVIISSGYRIGPFEVESALLEHAAVAESAVVSSPDDLRGEVVKAFVILTESFRHTDKEYLVSELQEHVKQTTAPYKYPRKIEFVEWLPKTVSGKIRRKELREKEWKGEGYSEDPSFI